MNDRPMGNLYIDTGWISLHKAGEQLCGDRVEFAANDQSNVCVLADGLGSGVKANILATLTSKILATMSISGMSTEDCVSTVVRTLPECSTRKIAYSTFTIIKVTDQQHVELTRFDNPHTVLLRGGKNCKFDYTPRMIENKKIYESRFEAQEGDILIVMSDGAIFSGLGGAYPFGWGRDNIIAFLEEHYDPRMTAKRIALMLADACNRLYEGRPGDDTTVAVMRFCKPHAVNLMIGPPSSRALDQKMMEAFFAQEGTHIVCGGTTNRITSEYLGHELQATLDYAESDLPPAYLLDGVDISTEGALTISRVLEYADEYLEGTALTLSWDGHQDAAARIARELFEHATEVNCFVGCAMNPAHQNPNLSLAFGAKFQLIEKLEQRLSQMGKRVTVRFF